MKKPIIGIAPTFTYKIGPTVFDDQFKYIHSYSKKIFDNGGVPIGLMMPDGRLNYESLELCDGFLIPGGKHIRKYIYEILYYAFKNNIPILGICMGGQSISIFSALIEKLNNEEIITYDVVKKHYDELKNNNKEVLNKLPSINMHTHCDSVKIEDAMHFIRINEGTLLRDVYGQKEIKVVSFHAYDFKFVENNFIISAFASDGVKEAIELNDPNKFMLGVHFHPELDENNKIFKRLIYESNKRK